MIELSGQAGLLEELRPRIRVVGVGGAGGNAVANMIRDNVPGVEFVVANTDAQALRASPADRLLQLGRRTTEGLGAGSRAEVGKAAAEESLAEIKRMLDGAHMCFIAAGLGGGTGTGAAPVIAEASRAMGILTVAVVTRPFGFEGSRRAKTADAGLEALAKHVDTLIVIPNQNLFRIANAETSFKAAFDLADQVLQQGVRGITDLMTAPGLVNLDFADVRTVMAGMGKAMMGSGEASGEARAARAAEQAMANPLLDEAIKGARGLIISISGGEDMRLMEVDEAATRIKALVDPEADIIWGSAFLPELEGRIRVSIVATGIDSAPVAEVAAPETVATAAVPVRPAFAASHVPAAAAQTPVQASLPLPEPRPTRGALLTAAAPGASMTAAKPAEQEAPPSPFLAAAREEQELLLTVERRLILPPAESAEPDDEEPIHSRRETARGPSLFERVATAARGVVIRRVGDTSPIAPVVRDSVFLGRRAA